MSAEEQEKSENGVGVGLIVGIVMAALVLVVILVVVVISVVCTVKIRTLSKSETIPVEATRYGEF